MTYYLPIEILAYIFSFDISLLLQSRNLNKKMKSYIIPFLKKIKVQYYHCIPFDSTDFSIVNCSGSYSRIEDNDLAKVSTAHTLILRYNDAITNYGLYILSNIHTLDIYHCSGISDIGLKYLSKIKKLNIGHCRLITNDGLKYLESVRNLDISSTSITDNGLKYLSNVTTLCAQYCFSLRESFGQLVNIRSLDLCCCINITDNGMKNIGELKYITKLDISYTQISDVGLSYLTNIIDLNISYCNLITNDGLSYLENIKKLNILYCTLIEDEWSSLY